jgi:hypothetical protein
MISSKALILSSGKGRPLLIQVNQNPSISLRPLLARNGPPAMSAIRSLSGEKRTWSARRAEVGPLRAAGWTRQNSLENCNE